MWKNRVDPALIRKLGGRMIEEKFKPTILVKRKVLREDCLRKGVYRITIETVEIRDKKDVPKVLGNKGEVDV